jgi:hypothetical protein
MAAFEMKRVVTQVSELRSKLAEAKADKERLQAALDTKRASDQAQPIAPAADAGRLRADLEAAQFAMDEAKLRAEELQQQLGEAKLAAGAAAAQAQVCHSVP